MKQIITYEVRDYHSRKQYTKEYKRYGNAYKYATKLINKGIDCAIYELSIMVDENGIGDMDTLSWNPIIGC